MIVKTNIQPSSDHLFQIINHDTGNKNTDKTIDRCCYNHESIVVCTYSSGASWLLCNVCDQDEVFTLGRTSRVRLTS
jgi:hypothetical protein